MGVSGCVSKSVSVWECEYVGVWVCVIQEDDDVCVFFRYMITL